MIELEANYSKKLGLPGYSSHQYSLTVRKEVSDISQVENESHALFHTAHPSPGRGKARNELSRTQTLDFGWPN